MSSSIAIMPQDPSHLAENKLIRNVLLSMQRPGSAPPQMDELPGSPLASNNKGATSDNLFAPDGPALGGFSDVAGLVNEESLRAYLADPEYVQFYYANRNINPRLPPPITSGRDTFRVPFSTKDSLSDLANALSDSNGAQAALNLLLGAAAQLSVVDNGSGAARSLNQTKADSGYDAPWSELPGSSSAAQIFYLPPDPCSDVSNSSFQRCILGDALLGGLGSPSSLASPLMSGNLSGAVQNPGLDSALGSNNARSSFNGASPGLGPVGAAAGIKDSKVTTGFHSCSPARAIGERQNHSTHTPSKLRNGSLANPADTGMNIAGLTEESDNKEQQQDKGQPTSAAGEAASLVEAFQNMSQPAHPSFEGLLSNLPSSSQPSLSNPQQLQAMYLAAAMYNPLLAQQGSTNAYQPAAVAMQQAASGIQMNPFLNYSGMAGFSGMHPFMGMQSPGGLMPFMQGVPPQMMPSMFGVAGVMPSAFRGGGMPGMPPEMALYYQNMLEAQAALATFNGLGGPGCQDQINAMAAVMAAAGAQQQQEVDGCSCAPGLDNMNNLNNSKRSNDGQGEKDGRTPKAGDGTPVANRRGVDHRSSGNGSQTRMPGMGPRGEQDRRTPGGSHSRSPMVDSLSNRSSAGNVNNGARRQLHMNGTPRAGHSEEGRSLGDRRSAVQDPLLEEFKSSKGHRFEFSDIMGHLLEFSLDQHGSRFIQQKLESLSPAQMEAALVEVLPNSLALVTDVFGNYVVQKFFEHGAPDQRLRLAAVLKGNIMSFSLQMYGCRVIQRALEVLPVEHQCEIIAELEEQIMRCVRDQNGNHVIQKVIEVVPTDRIQHLLELLLESVVPLSSHPFGCRVIQRILEHCQELVEKCHVMDRILKSARQLSQDQYGNYVIQHVLERGRPEERITVVNELAPEIITMSMHKFASNVVEKCLVHCSPGERDILIVSMLGQEPAEGQEPSSSGPDGLPTGEDALQQMMKDQFGNYVVQRVLEVCNDSQREKLLAHVRAQLHALKRYTYGKHIVARVEKLLSTGTRMQSDAASGDNTRMEKHRKQTGVASYATPGFPEKSTEEAPAPYSLHPSEPASSCPTQPLPQVEAAKQQQVPPVSGAPEADAAASNEVVSP